MKKYVFAITGTTGPIIGIRVLKEVLQNAEVHLILSKQSFPIILDEVKINWSGRTEKEIERKIQKYYGSKNIFYYNENNMYAPISSGSFKHDGMFVVPCSMKSLSAIANGYTGNLIHRAADVTIKEGRQLLISPREMPFSAIHLENMLKLARLGVKVVPPVIGYYHKPGNLDDMLDFVAGKILDAMGIEHDLYERWGSEK
jgi:4-hydroxy-3-polyprenylbenzoate decarboxylase